MQAKLTLEDLEQSADSTILREVITATSYSLDSPILKDVSRKDIAFKTIWHATASFALFNSFPKVFLAAEPNTPYTYFGYTAKTWNRAFQFLKYLAKYYNDDAADLNRLFALGMQKPIYYNDPSLQTKVSIAEDQQVEESATITLAKALSTANDVDRVPMDNTLLLDWYKDMIAKVKVEDEDNKDENNENEDDKKKDIFA